MEKTNVNLANKVKFIDAQIYYEDGQPYLYYTGVFDNGLEVEIPKINEIMRNPGKIPFIDRQQKLKYDVAPKAPMPKANFVETNKILGR